MKTLGALIFAYVLLLSAASIHASDPVSAELMGGIAASADDSNPAFQSSALASNNVPIMASSDGPPGIGPTGHAETDAFNSYSIADGTLGFSFEGNADLSEIFGANPHVLDILMLSISTTVPMYFDLSGNAEASNYSTVQGSQSFVLLFAPGQGPIAGFGQGYISPNSFLPKSADTFDRLLPAGNYSVELSLNIATSSAITTDSATGHYDGGLTVSLNDPAVPEPESIIVSLWSVLLLLWRVNRGKISLRMRPGCMG